MSRGGELDLEFANRLAHAWDLYERHTGGQRIRGTVLSQAWLGREVGEKTGRGKPYTQPRVSNWFAGEMPPPRAILAICQILSWEPGIIDPGWLTYGEASKAPPPPDPMWTGTRFQPRDEF